MNHNRHSQGTAIVTGASTGIGAAYADSLARRGYDLVLIARNGQRLEETAARLRAAHPGKVEVIAADLTESAAVAALAKRIETDSSISLVVNNAGTHQPGGVLGYSPEEVEKLIALNVTAPTQLTLAAAKAFLPRKAGSVVNLSSVTVFIPEMFDGIYSGTKNYLINLTLHLAAQHKDSGVRFQAVLPGPTRTELWGRSKVPVDVVPPEMVMEASELVEAALAGLDRGETVTLPTVQDEGLYQAFEAARFALAPHLANGHAALRYRESLAHV